MSIGDVVLVIHAEDTERKINQEVLEIVGEKCPLIDSTKVRRWKVVDIQKSYTVNE